MRVVVAPNAFKGTLSAVEAARVIADVFVTCGHDVDLAPMADGGDGTLDAFLASGHVASPVDVHDALLRPHRSVIAVRGDDAVVELARICGMQTVRDLPADPWRASTFGLGEAARAAIDAGATHIALAVGGSASVDGGVGFLQGLGFTVTDDDGQPVSPDAAGMARATHLAGAPPVGVTWTVLADVDNPLLGWDGAVMFAAQKGIAPDDVDAIHRAWVCWADVLRRTTGVDVRHLAHTGAAGGVPAAAHAVLGATLTSGAATVASMVDLERRIAAADLVVTGEGRFDEQSLHGKAPGIVIDLARRHRKPVAVLAGDVAIDPPDITTIATSAAPTAVSPEAALTWAASRLLG